MFPAKAHSTEKQPLPGRRALVVVSDEASRDALAQWLTEEGFDARAVGDGAEAARWMAPGALVITDRLYPAWEHLGTVQAIKQTYRGVRVVVIADGEDPFLGMARAVGADAVLSRPLRRGDLRAMIATL